MKKFFERNILDELYEAKSNEFGDNILKEMKKQNKDFESLKIEEKLTKKIKENVNDESKQNEILSLLNEFENKEGSEADFWNKMYYKLGAYDCTGMKNIIEENQYMEDKTIFFDKYSDDFCDYLNTNRIKILKRNKEYKNLVNKIEKIKEENPNVRTFFEDKEAVELTDTELNAILDILEIEGDMETIEATEIFKLGAKEMLLFLKQMNLF